VPIHDIENQTMFLDNDDSEKVERILKELENWPEETLTSHKSASHMIHKLVFLADIGLNKTDERIKNLVNKIIQHKSKEGVYQVKMNIPKHFGGTGEDQFAWALCDAPLIMYALIKFGVDYDTYLKEGITFLFETAQNNGWPCKCSDELGKFRGPGKKDDPCPYANLIMLKLANLVEEFKECESTKNGIEALLRCWEKSKEIHPYMFYMGTDFRKLKLPFIWYDILNVVDTLSKFEYVRKDKRFIEMVDIIKNKKTENGEYIPESIWKSWSEWDFGQKKKPSKYMKSVVNNILKRIER
jgi:hypothetical protein